VFSLFADQEREARLDSLGDPLALLDKHVDFAALAQPRSTAELLAPAAPRAVGRLIRQS